MLPHEMPSYERANLHRKSCKICSQDNALVTEVNNALLRGKSLKFVQIFLQDEGIDVTFEQIANHRKFLPFLISNDQLAMVVSDCRAEIYGGADVTTVDQAAIVVADARMAYEYAKTICQLQMWSGTVPQLMSRLQEELEGNKAIPVRDLAYALDLMIKNGSLLGGGATERIDHQGQVTRNDNTTIGILLRTDPDAREAVSELYRRSARLQATGEI